MNGGDAPAPATPREDSVPTAVLRPQRRATWVWLIPVVALLLAGWLGYHAWSLRGLPVTIHLENGHGLKVGDPVRFRGINVGKVDSIDIAPDLRSIVVSARLTSQADKLAQAGSRFWVVRPQLHLTRIEGLETLIGPRFLAVLPPSSADKPRRQRQFVGLDEPPIIESFQPGDLEIVLEAQQRGSLHAGAPVTYRQTRIGTILSVGLTGDAGSVEARAHIQQPFVPLIRPNTRFWDVGGVQAKLGFTGVTVEIESAEALLTGGVALATPSVEQAGGDVVRTGHRFPLVEKPEEQWLDWQPMVAIGSSLLPPGSSPPSPMRATIGWTQGRWITREKSRQGWVLQLETGLLGPADLLKPAEQADAGTAVLEVNGIQVPLSQPLRWEANGLAILDARISKTGWPSARTAQRQSPDECLVIADPTATPLPLSATRLTHQGQRWLIDPAVSIEPSWHGACVVSRQDGALIGLLLIDDEGASVALLTGA